MKKRIFAFLFATLMIVLTGCNSPNETSSTSEVPTQTETSANIVSLAPAYTRILLDLGLAGDLVAVDSYSAELLESLGETELIANLKESTLDMTTPNMEVLMSLKPTVLIASDMTIFGNENIFDPLEQAGCEILVYPTPSSIEGICADMKALASYFDKSAEADKQIAEFKQLLSDMEQTLEGLNLEQSPTVYYEISPAPTIYVVGSAGYQNEMITLAGGTNVFFETSSWLPVTEEAVIAANPDIIFTSVPDGGGDAVSEIANRPGWDSISAVQNNRIFVFSSDDASQPNLHIDTAIKQLHDAVVLYGQEQAPAA